MSSQTSASREPVSYNESEVAYGKVVSSGDSSAKQVDGAERVVIGMENRSAGAVPPSSGVPSSVLNARATRNAKYRVTALVLVSIALITAVGSVAISVKILIDCNNFLYPESDSSALYVIMSFLMYLLVLVECLLSIIATVTLIVILALRPENVLQSPAYGSGKHNCLCASLFLLFLFSAYSFAVPLILDGLKQYPKEPVALCVVPAFRMVSWLALFAVLMCYRNWY